MIWVLVVIVLLFWLIGWLVHIGGDLIHLLLILVFVGLVYQLLASNGTTSRRR